jgi:phage terminase small subunit
MGTAKHPHDKNRPESAAVLRALESDDVADLEMALTPRQKNFCREYVVDFNGAAAVVRAGYSPKFADRQAFGLMRNRGIRRLIDEYSQSKEAKIVSVTPDYVLREITAVVSKDGVKDNDKLRALELIARHLGMFIERQEITGKDGEAIRIERQKIDEDANDFLTKLRRMADKNQQSQEATLN